MGAISGLQGTVGIPDGKFNPHGNIYSGTIDGVSFDLGYMW